ncbi:MAG TPA: phage holin family protein, partial [Gemmiger formicilis]|nr:phage holin family protein [Gemmiger formicilis]
MEKRNLFVSGKAVVAAVCGAFTAAFGWLGWLVVSWAACMALDWVSGSAAAASRGAWSSAAARAGIWHKAGMVVVVLVCALTDAVLAVAVANLPGLGLEVNGVVLPVVLYYVQSFSKHRV